MRVIKIMYYQLGRVKHSMVLMVEHVLVNVSNYVCECDKYCDLGKVGEL